MRSEFRQLSDLPACPTKNRQNFRRKNTIIIRAKCQRNFTTGKFAEMMRNNCEFWFSAVQKRFKLVNLKICCKWFFSCQIQLRHSQERTFQTFGQSTIPRPMPPRVKSTSTRTVRGLRLCRDSTGISSPRSCVGTNFVFLFSSPFFSNEGGNP